jgi:DNA-binding HxlR family transcriptional regulator
METGTDLRALGGADAYLRNCPSRDVLGVIGQKWTLLILPALLPGSMRFGELRRRLDGVTQKSLTQALRGLERDGFVRRTQYPTIPPRVEYALTDLGRRACDLLRATRQWAAENLDEILAARAAFDARPAFEARLDDNDSEQSPQGTLTP